MSRKLAVNTTVAGVTYPAGSAPPDEVAEQITNPKCWGGSEAAGVPTERESGIPPKGGAGSGRDAWASYAKGKVDVGPDASRDDIIAALEAAGVPVE